MFNIENDLPMPNIENMGNMNNMVPTVGMVYFPQQKLTNMYPLMDGLMAGTIFPELSMPMKEMSWNMNTVWKEEY